MTAVSPDGAFTADERVAIGAAMDEMVPGSVGLGAVDYVELLLDAMAHDPAHVWAAPGAWSGDGPAWLELGPWERQAWTERIDGWRQAYARLAAGIADDADRRIAFEHACEATYGDPAYGGNRDGGAWTAVDFPEPLFPPRRAEQP